jgi:hypothetical protein
MAPKLSSAQFARGGASSTPAFTAMTLGPLTLKNRFIFQAGDHREGLCVHCTKCMATIYDGARCVLRPEPAGVPGKELDEWIE